MSTKVNTNGPYLNGRIFVNIITNSPHVFEYFTKKVATIAQIAGK